MKVNPKEIRFDGGSHPVPKGVDELARTIRESQRKRTAKAAAQPTPSRRNA